MFKVEILTKMSHKTYSNVHLISKKYKKTIFVSNYGDIIHRQSPVKSPDIKTFK